MDLRQEKADNGPVITGFQKNAFKVDNIVREGALLLTPRSLHPWRVDGDPLTGLTALIGEIGLDPAPELLLLGTGARLRRPTPDETSALEEMGIGLEVVDSRTAARIWGLLRAEERWIAAALLPPGA